MKVVKRLGTVVLSIVLWIVILVAALYAFTTMATRDNQNVANILGYTPLVVKSDSMAPTFSAGDLIFIKKCDTSTLEEGDIICFHTIIENEYALNTHRIKSIESVGDARSYTTIGDNNNGVADLHVISDGDIVGKYVGHLQSVGKVMDFLSSSTGFLIVIVLPMLLFFIYQEYHLIMISIRLKKAVAVETAREVEAAKMQAMNGAAMPQGMAPQNGTAFQNGAPGNGAAPQRGNAPQNNGNMSRNAEAAGSVNAAAKQNEEPAKTGAAVTKANTESAAPVNADQTSDSAMSAKTEAQRAKEEAQAALAEAQKIREEAEAIKAQAEAQAALAEAKRLREEAEAMKAQAQAELEKAKQDTEAGKSGSGEDKKA